LRPRHEPCVHHRRPRYIDRPPPGRWTYRVGLTANWLNDTSLGRPRARQHAGHGHGLLASRWLDWHHRGIAWPWRVRGSRPSGQRRTGTRGSGPSTFSSARTWSSTSVSPGRAWLHRRAAAFPARRSVRSALPRRACLGCPSRRRPPRVLRLRLRPARPDGLSGRPSDRTVRPQATGVRGRDRRADRESVPVPVPRDLPGRLADSVFMLGGLVALLGLCVAIRGSWSADWPPRRSGAARPSSRSWRSRRSASSSPATGARNRSAGGS
jgi:hypothetical protein